MCSTFLHIIIIIKIININCKAIRRHTMIIRTELNAEEEPPPADVIKDGTTAKLVHLGHDSGVCYLPFHVVIKIVFPNIK